MSTQDRTEVQIGWLRAGQGFYVTCLACIPRGAGEVLELCPIFEVNVGQYRQPCADCGAELTEGLWKVILFDGAPL